MKLKISVLTNSKCGSNISKEESVRTLSPQLKQKEGHHLGKLRRRGIKLMKAATEGKIAIVSVVYVCELLYFFDRLHEIFKV